MKQEDINTALKAKMDTGMTTLSGVWPNVDPDNPVSRPYFEADFPDPEWLTLSLSGEILMQAGLMAVTIVVEGGSGEDTANGYADTVASLFPVGGTITFTNGIISIAAPPNIRGGYRDGPDWRVPVMVRYNAYSQ